MGVCQELESSALSNGRSRSLTKRLEGTLKSEDRVDEKHNEKYVLISSIGELKCLGTDLTDSLAILVAYLSACGQL